MWRDIQETRDSNLRERLGSSDVARGGRGGRSERDDKAFSDRDVFVRAVDLPLGDERELVRTRERTYAIDGPDSRLLATIGAFRVIAERDLEQGHARLASVREHMKHLEAEGLLQRTQSGPRDRVVSLTAQGRALLETHRSGRETDRHAGRQAFYAGVRKPRELSHDSQVYRAYARAEARLRDAGGRVRRVVLDYELKRDYQQFLQARKRGRRDHDGRPDREPEEVGRWAREHDLPYFDDAVHFPDLRIEYDGADGQSRHQDIEITTGHYRGAHAAATARCGFVRYRSQGGLVGGRGGGRRAAPRSPGLAEEWL